VFVDVPHSLLGAHRYDTLMHEEVFVFEFLSLRREREGREVRREARKEGG